MFSVGLKIKQRLFRGTKMSFAYKKSHCATENVDHVYLFCYWNSGGPIKTGRWTALISKTDICPMRLPVFYALIYLATSNGPSLSKAEICNGNEVYRIFLRSKAENFFDRIANGVNDIKVTGVPKTSIEHLMLGSVKKSEARIWAKGESWLVFEDKTWLKVNFGQFLIRFPSIKLGFRAKFAFSCFGRNYLNFPATL